MLKIKCTKCVCKNINIFVSIFCIICAGGGSIWENQVQSRPAIEGWQWPSPHICSAQRGNCQSACPQVAETVVVFKFILINTVYRRLGWILLHFRLLGLIIDEVIGNGNISTRSMERHTVDSRNSGHQIWQKWKLKILTDF